MLHGIAVSIKSASMSNTIVSLALLSVRAQAYNWQGTRKTCAFAPLALSTTRTCGHAASADIATLNASMLPLSQRMPVWGLFCAVSGHFLCSFRAVSVHFPCTSVRSPRTCRPACERKGVAAAA